MGKFAIKNTAFLITAALVMLQDNAYDAIGVADYLDGTEGGFLLVNTDKKTYKFRATTDREAIDPATNWAAVASLVAAPAADDNACAVGTTTVSMTANGICVGDMVTATNTSKTKQKFLLTPGRQYQVDRITAKGNIGLVELPNDEYIYSRFTKVAGATATAAPTAAAPVATKAAVDAAGNTLAVGDTIVVVQPTGKKPLFSLRPNGVATITRITAKGALGFAFDADNEFLSKRVQKVTVAADATGIQSGDLVVVKADKAKAGTIFALPTGTALTFRGLTSTGGKFILDGYTEHQYATKRFQKVTKVGTVA